MKIAYFTSMYARASDTFIRNEVIELRTRGHSVHTISIRRAAADAAVSAEVADEQKNTCYILEVPKRRLAATILRMLVSHPATAWSAFSLAMSISPAGFRNRMVHLAYFGEALFLAAFLIERDIEIVHNHIAENSATVAMLASEVSGIPFSMTVHGPGIFYRPDRWALGTKIARSAFTACITDFCRSQCMVHADQSEWPKLLVIRCGVGREFEGEGPESGTPGAPRLLFVGRLCKEKGVPILLDAMDAYVRSGGVGELAIIGEGPLSEYVADEVDRRRLTGSVMLLGWRSSADVADELRRSRALVLPSFAEGLPIVILEALAMRRPVISTTVAGIPEIVSEDDGWLVPPGSTSALLAAIAAAFDTPLERLAQMGAHGARAVRERHSLAAQVDQLEAAFIAAVEHTRSAVALG